MKHVTLDQLPVPGMVRKMLQARQGVDGALIDDNEVVVFGSASVWKTEAEAIAQHEDATLVWRRHQTPTTLSKVAQAVDYMAVHNSNVHAAAKAVGVDAAAVYRAVRARKGRVVCHACGQLLP